MTRGNEVGGGEGHKVSPNDGRLRQLRNYKVSCDAVWIWSLVPQTRTFNGARLTARCSVTARQYTACLPHPFHTLSAPNTFYLYYIYTHTHSRSFDLIIPQVSKLLFCTQSNFSWPFFFSFNLLCCTHLVFILLLLCVTAFFFFYQLPVLYYTFSLYVFMPTFKTQPPFLCTFFIRRV